jgi:hypothetical protein
MLATHPRPCAVAINHGKSYNTDIEWQREKIRKLDFLQTKRNAHLCVPEFAGDKHFLPPELAWNDFSQGIPNLLHLVPYKEKF